MASQRKRVRRTPREGVLTEKDSGAAPASTHVRGCTQSHGQSCGACLERFFEPLTGAAAPAWELLWRQRCPKWTCCTNAAACVQACERGAQKSAEAGSPHAIRAGSQPRAPAGPQHERFANCERRGAEAHAPVGDTRFGVQGARARRVAHRAWPRTSVWYLLARIARTPALTACPRPPNKPTASRLPRQPSRDTAQRRPRGAPGPAACGKNVRRHQPRRAEPLPPRCARARTRGGG